MSDQIISKNQRILGEGSGVSFRSAMPLGILAGVAIISVIAFLIYFPAISGGFVLDDDQLLTESVFVKSSDCLDGLYHFWCTNIPVDFWPATNTTFLLEWRLWDMHSTGYHVTNLILHIAESLLIWLILKKLLIPGAFWAALIFAVHPVNVEATAWIAQRKDMTAMLFFLLSILWYLKDLSLGRGGDDGSRPETATDSAQGVFCQQSYPAGGACGLHFSRWYWLSLVAFVMAMLGKGSTAILPALLLGIVWWMRPMTRWDFVRMAPFFVVGALLAGVNVWFQNHGVAKVIRDAGIADRLAGAGCMVWFYIYKAILPIDLSFVYPQWQIDARNPFLWMPFLAALFVAGVLWLYRQSWGRPFLFAWGYFCVALVPVLGFTDIGFMKYSLVADRYQHIAIIGVIALVSAGLGVWQEQSRGLARRAAIAFAFVAVGALGLLTMRQSGLYHDAKTLYEATLVKNPGCWMVRNNLGNALAAEGRMQDAMVQFRESLALNPDYADAHSNVAAGLLQTGRYEEAIKHCEEALRLKNNNYPEAHHNIGIALLNLGRLSEAREHFEQALKLNPNYPDAENSLGSALTRIGRTNEAMEHFKKALLLNPDFADAHFNLGSVLAASGRYPEAIEQYEMALALKTSDPDYYYVMGSALIETGRSGQALEYLRQAIRMKPDAPNYYFHMANAYAGVRQTSQAVAAAQKALELARSKGQAALAKQIEDWLNSYRGSPKPKAVPP
jgi:protein O-mannosyl-transferase